MMMNLGLSGMAFTGADIGGFNGEPSAELFTRWLQMSVFLPFFRTHTHLNDPDQEPWTWGEPHLSVNRRWIEHRYRLLPYLYTAFWQCAQSGLPVARPLLMAFQQDAPAHQVDDQFMCGDDLLVAPVLEPGASRRTVYAPQGGWYDVWSDDVVLGPVEIEAEAPFDRIPIFVRAGSVIPLAPPVRYVGERPIEKLTLHVYPPLPTGSGQENPEAVVERKSMLYEDDGETFAFQDGDYRLTSFWVKASGRPLRELRLERRVEGTYDSACGAFDLVIHGLVGPPASVTCDDGGTFPRSVTFERSVLRLTLGSFQDLALTWGS
jgi:alpha-glucosidase